MCSMKVPSPQNKYLSHSQILCEEWGEGNRIRTADLLTEVLLTLIHDIVQVLCSSQPHEDQVQQLRS
jgi:hypothetical protein